MKTIEEMAEEWCHAVGEIVYESNTTSIGEFLTGKTSGKSNCVMAYIAGATSERERAQIEIEFWKNALADLLIQNRIFPQHGLHDYNMRLAKLLEGK